MVVIARCTQELSQFRTIEKKKDLHISCIKLGDDSTRCVG